MNPPQSKGILKVALPLPLPCLFDYSLPVDVAGIARGTRVLVPFGRRTLVGVVIDTSAESSLPANRILPISSVLDDCKPLLNEELLQLLNWCFRYYKHAPGEVVFNALPPALRRKNGSLPALQSAYALTESGRQRLLEPPGRARLQWALLQRLDDGPATADQLRDAHSGWRPAMKRLQASGWVETVVLERPALCIQQGPDLKDEQAKAVAGIAADFGRFRCHLLDGITGSGKTEVYLRLIEQVLQAGKQVLVLVPEIGLTPQLLRRFSTRLGFEPTVYHSGLSDGARLATWAAARSGQSALILGTRSALFMPLPNAGLLILDESHDASFKQQDGFRFAARDVAVKRAADLDVPIVLGSATPSLETMSNAMRERYTWHRLRQRATGANAPDWRVLDLREQRTEFGLSEQVLEIIQKTLDRGEQVIVFLNRRGYAPVLLCHDCGWHAACQHCDANMTWHRTSRRLVCHHCGSGSRVPTLCPDCRADALQGAGEGTQQLEQGLQRRFPGVPLHRFDRDEVRGRKAFEEMSDKVRHGGACLLVGTQMLAKGHHFPLVTRVVIVDLDQALYSGDFRALERMGQLMVQVAGRAGREQKPGEVLLQTHHPDHPLIELLLREGYEAFARALLEDRKLAGLPPFAFQAVLRAEASDRQAVQGFLQQAQDVFTSTQARIHGPYPAQMERRGGRLRWYLLVQHEQRPVLQAALDGWLEKVRALPGARQVRWAIDVDPQEF